MTTPKLIRNLPPTGQTLTVLLATVAFGILLQTKRWDWAAVGLLPLCAIQAVGRLRGRSTPDKGRSATETDQLNESLVAALAEVAGTRQCQTREHRAFTYPPPVHAGSVAHPLYALSAAVRSPAYLQTAVDALAREALRAAPGITATVAILGADGLYRVTCATGLYSDRLVGLITPSAPESWQRALSTGKPVVNTAPDEGVLGAIPASGSADLRCALVAPLVLEGRALGVVSVFHSRREAFSARDAERLSLVTEIVAESLHSDTAKTAPAGPAGTLPRDASDGALTRRLEARLESPPSARTPFAVLLIHLDRLEPDVAPRGFAAEDPMLAEAAAVVRACLRLGDALEFRVDSGFAVIVDGASPDTPVHVCSRITTAVERMAVHLGVHIAASAGYGVYPGDGRTSDDLLAAATRRLRMDRSARLPD